MFHVGDVVRKLRLEKKWTLDDLVRESGVSRGTLSLLEQGKANTTKAVMEKVADALGTTAAQLYAAVLSGMRTPVARPDVPGHEADLLDDDVTNYVRNDIPVIQEGEASPNGLTWDAGDPRTSEAEKMSRPYDFKEKGTYAIVLRGDSMEPILKRGMRLVMSVVQPVSDGDIVYVQMRNGERLVKIATRVTDGWMLTSANPAHPPRQVNMSEIQHIHKVAWVRFLK